MEKCVWHKTVVDRNSRKPSPRWGHAACAVQNSILFFGGYADANYMNDLWSFNTIDMTWEQHKTTGTVPSQRSNCTLHYDQNTNAVILIGGGGPNKKRFNAINLLDWNTKEWTEISPLQNEKAPWERTYHSSGIIFPYIFLFGGEGIGDLDDLWMFNLNSRKWTEITLSNDKPKPCARRFHTSVVLNNEFYVIAGCHGKYRCLSDIWKINLSQLLETGKTDKLEWQEVKIKGASFLTRWGHSSAVFNQKIYVFGGRFSNDLQDVLVIDPQNNSIKTLKVRGEVPKPRRRHSAVFVGSSLLVFGGFNGEYYNDMAHINVFDSTLKTEQQSSDHQLSLLSWVGRQDMSDGSILSTSNNPLPIHKGLMVSRFNSEHQLQNFIEFLQQKYTSNQLMQIIQILYLGAGKLPEELTQNFQVHLFETLTDKRNHLLRLIDPEASEVISLLPRKKVNHLISLDHQKYTAYLEKYHQQQFYDLLITFGQECVPVNKTLLAANSQYFHYMLRNYQEEYLQVHFEEEFGDLRVMQVLFTYLQSGYLVVPEGLDQHCWILLYHISEYLCITPLMNQCQHQLIALLNPQNCEFILNYASERNIQRVAIHSGEMYFKQILMKQDKKEQLWSLKHKARRTSSQAIIAELMELTEFDLRQKDIREGRPNGAEEKSRSSNNIEKENEIEYGQE